MIKDSCCIPILAEEDPNRVSKSVRTLRQASTISSEDLSLSDDDGDDGDAVEVESSLAFFEELVRIPSINRLINR